MCGIAGGLFSARGLHTLSRDGQAALQACLEAMASGVRHRGPDDSGVDVVSSANANTPGALSPGWVGLAQRRLSIIDLSAAGHQPMHNPRTGDRLIYNGELYNFKALKADLVAAGFEFRGNSDTEVILYAFEHWGIEASLKKFAGMFALAFWDARAGQLIIARDPLGIKPLYVWQRDDGLLFCSEIRALAAGIKSVGGSPTLNPTGLATFLAFGAVQSPTTTLKDVRSFTAGTLQRFELSNDRVVAHPAKLFWDFPAIDNSLTPEGVNERLRVLLDQSVREHMISDVPVGVFLSGGLDSSILASLASRHASGVRSFTVGFPDESDLSESLVAAETAKHLGIRHTDIPITHDEALASSLEWMNSIDQPSIDGLNTFVISKAVRAQGIVVALSGLGGDELFCGYPLFGDLPRVQSHVRKFAFVPSPLRVLVSRILTRGKAEDIRLKFGDMVSGPADLLRLAVYRRRLLSNHQLSELGIRPTEMGLDETGMPKESLNRARTDDRDTIAAISRYEMLFYMRHMLLRDSDNMAMAHGLEIRVPMLDTRLVDFAASIPGRLRMPEGKPNKALLRSAFREHLREDLLSRPKMGFTLPITRWLAGPMRDFAESSVDALQASGLFRREAIDAIWSRFLAEPKSHVGNRALSLVVLGHYIERSRSIWGAADSHARVGSSPTPVRVACG